MHIAGDKCVIRKVCSVHTWVSKFTLYPGIVQNTLFYYDNIATATLKTEANCVKIWLKINHITTVP